MSVAKLVTPVPVRDAIRERILKMLADLTVKAEAGELTELVIIFQRHNGRWGHDESGSEDLPAAIGRLEIVKTDWIDAYKAQHDNCEEG